MQFLTIIGIRFSAGKYAVSMYCFEVSIEFVFLRDFNKLIRIFLIKEIREDHVSCLSKLT